MKNKLFKIQSYITLIPFIGFVIVMFWAMIVCYRQTKSMFSALKCFLFAVIPIIVFSLLYYLIVYFAAVPMIQAENIGWGLFLILFFAYILCVMCGLVFVIIEKSMVKKFMENGIK